MINRALEEYLDREDQSALKEEARRQSVAASRKAWKKEKAWEEAAGEVWGE